MGRSKASDEGDDMRYYDQDHDIPEYIEFTSREHTARVEHECEHCRRGIHPGQRYVVTTGTVDGEFFERKAHVERCTSMWYGWTPEQMAGEVRSWEDGKGIYDIDRKLLTEGIREVCDPDLATVLFVRLDKVPILKHMWTPDEPEMVTRYEQMREDAYYAAWGRTC